MPIHLPRRLLLAAVAVVGVLIIALPAADPTEGLKAQPPEGPPQGNCAAFNRTDFYITKTPPVTEDLYFIGMELEMEGIAQVFRSGRLQQNGPCETLFMDLGPVRWVLSERPQGSNAAIHKTDDFHATIETDVEGTYVVTFEACRQTACVFQFPNQPVETIFEVLTTSVTIVAEADLAFPPRRDPVLPSFTHLCVPGSSPHPIPAIGQPLQSPGDVCSPTNFSEEYRLWTCADTVLGGGGIIDPQWVTVKEWAGPAQYELVEGVIQRSRVARKDSPLNHYSNDALFGVTTDLPYRYLIAQRPEEVEQPHSLGVEWETSEYPEFLRPTIGDRVSAFGYWMQDCGHEPYYTEIHPAVGIATHRIRPVLLPEAEGFGSNVYVPGVVSDVFFNEDGGEITDNCSLSGLHQPGSGQDVFVGDDCIPVPDDGGPNPLNRSFTYHIYLPPSPEDILSDQGDPNPPEVELYMPPPEGSGGPAPVIEVKTSPDGVTYLEVTINLSAFPDIHEYYRRITAAWKYPAPDNWGLKEYQVRLTKIDVDDDSDPTWEFFGEGGDWRMWMNVQNTDQEWTKIMDCDDCLYDDSIITFGNRPWETGAGDADRYLGPNVKLFPEQFVRMGLTGFEDDSWEMGDDIGTVNLLIPQQDTLRVVETRNFCHDEPEIEDPLFGVDIVSSECGDYVARFEIVPLGALPAQLSAEGLAFYEDAKVNAGDINSCLHESIHVCFDDLDLSVGDWHPNGNHPPGPKPLNDLSGFRAQSHETFAFTDIDHVLLGQILANATALQLDMVLEEIHEEVVNTRADHVPWEFLVLEAVLPPGEWEQHFSDITFERPIWGDIDCDGDVDEFDAVLTLASGLGISRAPCYNTGDTNCDGLHAPLDALAMIRFKLGLPNAASSADCRAIGDPIYLTFDIPPLPTPTPTSTATVTPTVTPTATPTATPTPTPSPTPSPTPDTTGPSIGDIAESPDPICDSSGPFPSFTTISAIIADPSGVASVVLHRRFVNGGVPAAWGTVIPTLNIGNGRWEADLDSPNVGVSGGRIDWYWEATDTAANTSLNPSDAPTNYYSTTVNYCD